MENIEDLKFICKICKEEVYYKDRSRFIKGCCFECAKKRRLWGEYYKRKAIERDKNMSNQFPINK